MNDSRRVQAKIKLRTELTDILFWGAFEAEVRLSNTSVRTAKKTQHFIITKINWLMLFKEIIAVYLY
jgi:hypothetical protein